MNIGTNVTSIAIPEGAAKNIKRGTEMLWQDGGLPTAFQRCEYIASNANQLIRCGFRYQVDSVYVWHFSAKTTERRTQILIANNINYDSTFIGAFGKTWSSKEGVSSDISSLDYSDITATFNKSESGFPRAIITDGVQTQITNRSNKPPAATDEVLLFDYSAVPQVPYGFIGSVKKISVEQDDNLIRNFIPCYLKTAWNNIPAGTIGLYDLCGSICPLTNTPFYINAGTSAFTKGPDIL